MACLAPKWLRLEPKLDKSRTLSDQISVNFNSTSKPDLKKSRILSHLWPIWPTFGPNLSTLTCVQLSVHQRSAEAKGRLKHYRKCPCCLQPCKQKYFRWTLIDRSVIRLLRLATDWTASRIFQSVSDRWWGVFYFVYETSQTNVFHNIMPRDSYSIICDMQI